MRLGVPPTPDEFFAGQMVVQSFGGKVAELYFTVRAQQAHTLRVGGLPGSSSFTTRIRIDPVRAGDSGLPAPEPVLLAHPATDGGREQHLVDMGTRNCAAGFSLVPYPAVSDDPLPEWLVRVDDDKRNGARVGIIDAEFQPVARPGTEEVVVGMRCRDEGIDVTHALRVAAVRYALDGDAAVEPGKSFGARLETGLRGDVVLLEGPDGLLVSSAGDIQWHSPRVPGGKGLAALVLDVRIGDKGPLPIRLPVAPAPGEGFLHPQSFDTLAKLQDALLADIDADGTDELLYPVRGAIGIYPLDAVSTATLRTVPCLARGSFPPRVAQSPAGEWQVYCVSGKEVRVFAAADGTQVSRYVLETPGLSFPNMTGFAAVGDLDEDGENDVVLTASSTTYAFGGGSGRVLFSVNHFPYEAEVADLGEDRGTRFVYSYGTRDPLTGEAIWEVSPSGVEFADLWHFGVARSPAIALAQYPKVILLDALSGTELKTWYPTGNLQAFDYRLHRSSTGDYYIWSGGRDEGQSSFGLWARRMFVDPVTLDITDDPAFPRDISVQNGIWRQYLHGGMQRLTELSTTATQRVVYDLDGQLQETLTGDRLQGPYDGGALAIDDAGDVRVWVLFHHHQPHGGSDAPALVGYGIGGDIARIFRLSVSAFATVIHVRYDHDGDAIVDPVLRDGGRVVVISGATGAPLYQSAMHTNLNVAGSIHTFVREGDLYVVPWVDGSTTTQVVFDIAGNRLLTLDLTQVGRTSPNGIVPVDILDIDGEPALEVSVDYPRAVEVYSRDEGGNTVLVSSRRMPAIPLAAWTGDNGRRYYMADASPANEHVRTPVVLDMEGNSLCGQRDIDEGWRGLDIVWNGGVVRLSGSPYKETSVLMGIEPCSGRVRWESAAHGRVYGAGEAGMVLRNDSNSDFKILY